MSINYTINEINEYILYKIYIKKMYMLLYFRLIFILNIILLAFE